MQTDGKGKRFNQGKIRYDLVPTYAQEQYAKVLTAGAQKYGDHNWKRGMSWTSVIASLERHLEAIKKGEDYDKETGLLHSAHIMCNAGFLTEYYKIFPQGDDRQHFYLISRKIGLDIDGVLAKTTEHLMYEANQNASFDKNMEEKLQELYNDKDFWLTMPVNIKPEEITFQPYCYITSRPIPSEWTRQWIVDNGFPLAPIYNVESDKSKLSVAHMAGIEIMVDDRMENFIEFNRNGICCYLFDTPFNKIYDVGHKRIYNLAELMHF